MTEERSQTTWLREQTRLDLGSGPNPAEGFLGVDREPAPGVIGFDLASGDAWPFADGQIEQLRSTHFIEHIPMREVATYQHWADNARERSNSPTGLQRSRRKQDALCWFMDEAWRVAKLGARFELRWPALVDRRQGYWGIAPYIDPTHRRFIPFETLPAYFSKQGREVNRVTSYGECNWIVVEYAQGELGAALVEEIVVLERGPA